MTVVLRSRARLEHSGESSEWFPWAWVGADDVEAFAARAGLGVRTRWELADRWFGFFDRCGP